MEEKSTLTPSTADAEETSGLPERPWWDPVRLGRRSVFPAFLQAAALAVMIFLIFAGWGRHGVEGMEVEGPLLYTNLATLGFWVVWFMFLVLLLPVVGRLWCTVCPVGWCNDLTARAGAGRSYPRALQNFGLMAFLLLGLSLTAELLTVNRYPDYTSWLLIGVLVAALGAGVIFRGRVFCRYWCPVGGMAGLYSRLSPLEIGSRSHEVCRRCESKACYTGSTRWYRLAWSGWQSIFPLRRPGCPAFIFPPEAHASGNCLMCTQCFKNCPHDNLRWGRRPFFAGLWKTRVGERSEALLVIVLTGIVFYRLARFWGDLRVAVEWPATFLASHLSFIGPTAYAGLKFFAGFALWPLLFFLLIAGMAKISSEVSLTSWPGGGEDTTDLLYDVAEIDGRLREERVGWEARKHTLWGYLAVYGHAFLPLVAAAYGAFALVKLNEKLAYLSLALADPAGIRTYLGISELMVIPAPESLLPLAVIRWTAAGLLSGGMVVSFWAAKRTGEAGYGPGSPSARRGSKVFRAGILLLGCVMLYCLKIWLFRA